MSAEYHFLAGEYERVVTLFENKHVKKLSPKDADTYGWSLLILGDRLHSAAKADDSREQYRSAIRRFEAPGEGLNNGSRWYSSYEHQRRQAGRTEMKVVRLESGGGPAVRQ